MGVINKDSHIRKEDNSNSLVIFEKNTNIEDILNGFNYEYKQGRTAKWYSFTDTNEYIMAMFILEKCHDAHIRDYW